MAETIVDTVYKENKSVIEYLFEQQEVSFQQDMDNKLKKILLVSAASYFETRISEMLVSYFRQKTNNNENIVAFLKNKAISRQYHSYFDWERGTNINKFLSLFGDDFKREVSEEIRNCELDSSVRAFLKLGNLRNQLVHINMAAFNIYLTGEEIYELYKEALKLMDYLESKLA
ncbi:HEPN domain-containing protein [Neobacillus drentensis]|uniref:HEPN domain-containing protein n=1 Tax=Neobacillus drentensis TaxID=220684 RepID=UPI002856440F|nr:HEPN domain-containing protein [Neobacillus drentensis]MDR7237319.1 hypothetical protein [Neobacillus drentensis]